MDFVKKSHAKEIPVKNHSRSVFLMIQLEPASSTFMIITIKAFVHYNCYEQPKLYLQFLLQKGFSGSQQLPLWFRLALETTGFCGIKYSGFLNPSLVYWGKVTTYREGAHDSGQSEWKAGCTGNVKDVLLRRASVAFPVVYKPARYYVWKICKQFVAAVC